MDTFAVIGINLLVIAAAHAVSWLLSCTIPLRAIAPGSFPFRVLPFERRFSERFLLVRKWKDAIPNAASFWLRIFPTSRLSGTGMDNFEQYARVTCREEASHLMPCFLCCSLFFWNPLWIAFTVIVVVIALNLPFVIVLRYNRERLVRALDRRRNVDEAI